MLHELVMPTMEVFEPPEFILPRTRIVSDPSTDPKTLGNGVFVYHPRGTRIFSLLEMHSYVCDDSWLEEVLARMYDSLLRPSHDCSLEFRSLCLNLILGVTPLAWDYHRLRSAGIGFLYQPTGTQHFDVPEPRLDGNKLYLPLFLMLISVQADALKVARWLMRNVVLDDATLLRSVHDAIARRWPQTGVYVRGLDLLRVVDDKWVLTISLTWPGASEGCMRHMWATTKGNLMSDALSTEILGGGIINYDNIRDFFDDPRALALFTRP